MIIKHSIREAEKPTKFSKASQTLLQENPAKEVADHKKHLSEYFH